MNTNDPEDRAQFRDEEAALWQGLWAFYTRVPGILDAELQAAHGLNHAAFVTLRQLAAAEGSGVRMSDLGEHTCMTLSHLSRVVTRLEGKGWVERVPDPSDGRATLAVLTSSGRNFLHSTLPGYCQRVRELLFDHLTIEEVRQVARAMDKLATAFDATAPESAGSPAPATPPGPENP